MSRSSSAFRIVILIGRPIPVHGWYFHADEVASDAEIDRGLDDVAEGTAYGVLSAVTRVARDFSPHRQQDVGIALASHLEGYFGLRAYEARVPEAS